MQKLLRYLLILPAFLGFLTNSISAQYCIPDPTYGAQYDTYIDSVRIGDIKYHDATSPKDTSYNDLTLDYYGRTHLTRGSTFTIYIQGSPFYSSMRYIAWIDYNNDKDFTDSNEKLGEFVTTSANQKSNFSFTVPSTATIGNTRLRVRCVWNISNPDPCTDYEYGETEDYTVSISDFAKTATAIDGAGEFELEFFNIGDDADYDLIQIDEYDNLVPVNFFNNNGSGTFSVNSTFLGTASPAFSESNMSYNLCDLNNDNRIDLLLTSRNNTTTPRTTYFQNNGTQLIQTTTGLPNLSWGSTATADFNNDGRQDVLICGRDAGNIPRTYIYMNSASGFVLINDKLKGVYGQIAVADYDNDRDVDILLTGNDRYGNSNSIIYRNDNNWTFTEVFTNIYKYIGSLKPQFIDFNNDGNLDLLCGKAYRNDGNGVFTEIKAYSQYDVPYLVKGADIDNDGVTEIVGQGELGVVIYKYNGSDSLVVHQNLIGYGSENLDIGDINGDRKQDIIVNDYQKAYIFRNQTAATNNIPAAPPEITSSIGDSGFYSVSLKWKSGTDDKTPVKGLTYNLRVGTTSGGNQIFSSMTSTTTNNPLLKPGMGNVYKNKSWFLKDLSPGTYYWSVQTVDNSGLASAFSTERTFTILEPLTISSFLANGRLYNAGAGADLDGDNDIDLIINDASMTIHRQTAPFTYTAVPQRANCVLLGINDLNKDNLPDLIVRHTKQSGELADSLELFINLGNMNFTTAKIDTIFAASVSTAATADFDNDGDIDILIHSKGDILFENTGNLSFTRRNLNLTSALFLASVSAIDLDQDGDNDYIVAGKEDAGFFASLSRTYVYENTGNLTFSLMQSITPGIGSATFTIDVGATATNPADINWNDFNFDGYPDLLLTGEDEYRNSLNQIFLNDGTGQLVSTSLSPRPADRYSSTWIDFNTDGFLDIIIPRIGYTVDNSIYFNNENTGFNGFSTVIDNIPFPAFIKALDVDNDKDKDILVTNKIDKTVGFTTETVIYTNNNNKVNQAPNPPTTTSSQIDVFDVVLNWNNGWDKLTINSGLTYNIWVGTANNKADIVSPMADLTTGYRYVEALGNVGTNTSWRLKNLPLGTYYWSVQTIDNSMTPSAWAPVKSFTLSALTANFSNDEVCLGFNTQLTDISVTTHPITSWKWVIGGKTVSTAKNPLFRFTTPGNNSVKLVVESAVAKDSITKNVFVKPVPEAAFSNNTVCAGTSTAFTNTTTTNGLTMSEWHWDFGDNSGSNVQNPGTHGYLVAGTYNTILVAVADNGCSDTIRKAVDVGVIPTAAITLTGLPNFCSDDSVKLVNSLTDTYTYSWQNGGADITGAATNTYTTRQTGSYTVKVTNPVGNCTAVSPAVNITVKESPLRPAIAFTGDTVFCAGENLLLSAPYDNDLTYKWKLNGGSVGKDTSIHAAEIGGEYTLVVTNSQGCSSFSANKVEIKVNSRPAAATLSPPSKPQICQGEDVVLGVTAFPAYSYQWLNENTPVTGAVSNTLRVSATGKYQLEISNASGCSIRTNTVDIVVNASPVKPLIDTSNYNIKMCVGEKPLKISIYNPIENYSYTWYKNGAPTSSMTFIEDFLEDGNYYVEADLNGCKSSSEVISLDFTEAMPKPVIEPKGPVVWYLTTNSKAEHYKWYHNGNKISDAVSSTYMAGQKLGTYRVSISNDDVCYRISDAVTIPTTPGLTGIEDSDPFEGVKIYPNPTTGMFTIEMNNNIFGELVIDIITQNGSKILNIRFDKSTEYFQSQIDLSGQPNGMYLINLSLDKFKAVRKVLVE